jgi:alpha-L-fucosidase
MKFIEIVKMGLLVFCLTASSPEVLSQNKEKVPYTDDWFSLSSHNEAPDWFKDAKFGIYFHWGVYSVPAFSTEWYPYLMHFPGKKENVYHVEKYGDLSDFGYHDFVPMFQAENFDAEEWAKLFKQAGAKFAGPVAEHHDGFSMWDSEVNPWNAKDKGPNRDIVGELEKAIRDQEMKFITTFHHARQLQRYADKPDEKEFFDSHYPFIEGMPTTSTDPELKILYGNIPEEEWLEKFWYGKLKEVVDQYHPDIMWFDSWLHKIPESYRKKFSAYFLNQAEKRNQEVVIVRKQNDLPLEMSVDDLEKSRKNELDHKTWMTDETLSKGSWSYTTDLNIKSAEDIIHILVDIASKNGVMLLNISPKANGNIPQDQKNVLLEIGKWLQTNGEAIYGTRPWYTYGEGPTKEPEGHFENRDEFLKIKYSADDVRYTTRVGAIYATVLGQAEAGNTITLNSFSEEELAKDIKIKNVSFIGSDEKIEWDHNKDGLFIKAPEQQVNSPATTIKIHIQDIDGVELE